MIPRGGRGNQKSEDVTRKKEREERKDRRKDVKKEKETHLLSIVQSRGTDVHLDVRVLDKLALVPLAVGVDVLDMAVGVDPFESEVVPFDGGGGGGGESDSHCGRAGERREEEETGVKERRWRSEEKGEREEERERRRDREEEGGVKDRPRSLIEFAMLVIV